MVVFHSYVSLPEGVIPNEVGSMTSYEFTWGWLTIDDTIILWMNILGYTLGP